MNDDELKSLGEIAEKSATGLGVLLLIFYALLQHVITKLTETQAFIVLLLVVVLVWSVALVGVVARIYLWSKRPPQKRKGKQGQTGASATKVVRSSLLRSVFLVLSITLSLIVSLVYLPPSNPLAFALLGHRSASNPEGQIAAAWEDRAARSLRITWDIARFPTLVSAGETLYLVTTTQDHRRYWRKTQIQTQTGKFILGFSEGENYVLIVSPKSGAMEDAVDPEDVKVILEAELPK